MISPEVSDRETRPTIVGTVDALPKMREYNRKKLHYLSWIFLVLACCGASWFAYQYVAVPQQQSFTPDWHGAQWIQAPDGNAQTAYFRYAVQLDVVPGSAFMTIAADQVFQLYVNGKFISSSRNDFTNYPRAYMYEVTPALIQGLNIFAIRVDNLNSQAPLLRANFTTITDRLVSYYGTGSSWHGTAQANLVYPVGVDVAKALISWTNNSFNDSSWQPVKAATQASVSPLLTVNPLVYETPAPAHWLNATGAASTFFVQKFSLPAGYTSGWLRIVSIGTADVFLNGQHLATVAYTPIIVKEVKPGKQTSKSPAIFLTQLIVNVYNISPYLHSGTNIVALHVSLQPTNATVGNAGAVNPSVAVDALFTNNQNNSIWLTGSNGWFVAHQAQADWTTAGADTSSAWTPPVESGLPNGYSLSYSGQIGQLVSTLPSSQIIPVQLTLEVILVSVAILLGFWLFMALVVMRRYFRTRRAALEMLSMAYLPALALELLLLVLTREPLIPGPFPYTGFWGLALLALLGLGYLFIWLHVRNGNVGSSLWNKMAQSLPGAKVAIPARLKKTIAGKRFYPSLARSLAVLRVHWPIIVLVVITLPLVFYNLGYETYWKDELDSYYPALSILRNGLPLLPSGFVYAKGEFYSYLLALFMKLFGQQAGTPRMVSAIEYVLTLVLCYRVGCYFFGKRVALIATIMLAFSPYELLWSREIRMYQQAQLFVLLTMYLFYRAVEDRQRIYRIYLAAGMLCLTYLSHEETFIVLPALLICLLVVGYIKRDAGHRLPSILYQKHWWFALAIVVGVIGLQLTIVRLTHPSFVGTDNSMRPEIQFTTDNLGYYFRFFFLTLPNVPIIIALSSVLTVFGCIWARKSRDIRVQYVALFLIMSVITLLFVFTMRDERYFYPVLPLYYLLGAYALVKIARSLYTFASTRSLGWQATASALPERRPSFSLKILATAIAFLILSSALVMPMIPLNSYNLFISKTFGLPYYHHFMDLTDAGQYVEEHIQPGDIVISVIADTSVLYYMGQSDYFISINHALYLFEQNGHIVDTYTGKAALLNESDFQAVLSSHARIWLISSYSQQQLLRHFSIPSDFHIVYAGSDSLIYLRSS